MNDTKHAVRLWLFAALTLLMMIAIFWFSAQNAFVSQQMSDGFLASLVGQFLNAVLPRLSAKGMQFDIRKYAHMCEFMVLAVFAFLYASEYRLWRRDLRAALLAFGFSLFYADIPVSQSLGNGSVLANPGRVVRAQIRDEARLIGDVLNVAGNHLDT